MASKRDQSTMSYQEFKDSGLMNWAKKFVKEAECMGLTTLGITWSKQAITRIKKSAKIQKISPLELLCRFARKG